MRTVLVYRSRLLPLSETFIKEQVQAYRSWRGILVGRQHSRQLVLDGLDTRFLEDERQSNAARWLARLRWLLGSPPRLSTLRQDAAVLMHAHFGVDALEAAPIARSLTIPLVVTLHGYDINIKRQWWEDGHSSFPMRYYPRRLLALAAEPHVHFIAVSDALKRRAIAYGIPSQKVTTHYIGVDIAKFSPGPMPIVERGRRVLFVGRLVEKKGCEYLLRSIPQVQAQVPDVEVAIVGDGPLRHKLERLSHELRIDARFLGALSPLDVKAELDRARVFCLPSIEAENGDAEGFGLVLLEAQAAGLPVVTSAIGGAEEGMVDGETGYRFIEKDINTLAARLVALLLDDRLATAMAAQARPFVAQRFDLTVLTARLEAYYNECIVTKASAMGVPATNSTV